MLSWPNVDVLSITGNQWTPRFHGRGPGGRENVAVTGNTSATSRRRRRLVEDVDSR
jgi:hypothetical protein